MALLLLAPVKGWGPFRPPCHSSIYIYAEVQRFEAPLPSGLRTWS